MKKQTIFMTAAAALLTAGCLVTSIHPYFTAKDVVFEPAIVGQWTNTQSDDRWVFEKEGKAAYRLAYTGSGKTNMVTVRLFKLDGRMFLDFYSPEPQCDVFPPPIPSHLLLRVYQITPGLRMTALNNDWLRSVLEKDPKVLRHELIGDKSDAQVVLTAETGELQQFLRSHLETEEAWKDPFELKRVDVP